MDQIFKEHPYILSILVAVIFAIGLLWNETTKHHSLEKKKEIVKNKKGETITMIIILTLLGWFFVFAKSCLA